MNSNLKDDQILNRALIVDAFEELELLLKRERIRANLYMVGGSAMIIGFGSRRQTRDVDVLLKDGSAAVFRLARVVARKLSLPSNWLNDSVRNAPGFPPREDKRALRILNSPNLVITCASHFHLIAMKAHAGRDVDMDDLRFLLEQSGIRTLEEVVSIHKTTFPYDDIPRKNIEGIEYVLSELIANDKARKD